VNNGCFTHTADPVFADTLLFRSVGTGKQLTHQLLVIKNTELK